MAEELVMPRLSDTMEQGTIARWLKQEGDQVAEGDVLAEIETDKATMELNSYADGVLLKILVGDGESAALGAPIAIVGAEGEEVPEDAGPRAAAAPANGGGEPAAADAPTVIVPRQAQPDATANGGVADAVFAAEISDRAIPSVNAHSAG